MSYVGGSNDVLMNGSHRSSETMDREDQLEYDDDERFEHSMKDILHGGDESGGSGDCSAGEGINSHGGDLGVRSGRGLMGSGMYNRGWDSSSGVSEEYSASSAHANRSNTLATTGNTHSVPMNVIIPPVTSEISLSSLDHTPTAPSTTVPPPGPQQMPVTYPYSKLDNLRSWSFNTYKYTRQVLSEKLGRSSRTVDPELEAQIEILRDTQGKYANVLRHTLALIQHFHQVTVTQRALSEAFSDLAQKNPELGEEFSYNSETQRVLCKNGDTLLGALNSFSSTMSTLCNKTMDDTLITVKHYEDARVEFDAYRLDLEALQAAPRSLENKVKLEDAHQRYKIHKDKFEGLRSDITIKMKFLDENRVKVMHKQLLLLHNAVASYFSGNQSALDETLKQFNIKLKTPNSDKPSWLEARN